MRNSVPPFLPFAKWWKDERETFWLFRWRGLSYFHRHDVAKMVLVGQKKKKTAWKKMFPETLSPYLAPWKEDHANSRPRSKFRKYDIVRFPRTKRLVTIPRSSSEKNRQKKNKVFHEDRQVVPQPSRGKKKVAKSLERIKPFFLLSREGINTTLVATFYSKVAS